MKPASTSPTDDPSLSHGSEAATDPVCGMTVDPKSATAHAAFEGQTYYFCCEHCRDAFVREPQRYLRGKHGSANMRDHSIPGHSAHPSVGDQGPLEAAVTDPVCGMSVTPALAVASVERSGHTYYFCSTQCRDRFVQDPTYYLDREQSNALTHTPHRHSHAEPAARGASYVCPMDPEVRQSEPGPCPKCGMALEPDLPAAGSRVEWTCPMHPEVVRSEP
jgi:Cu+-exporting ATPase